MEARLGGVRERGRLLNRVKEMPIEISNRRRQADELSVQIAEINRQIEDEGSRVSKEVGRTFEHWKRTSTGSFRQFIFRRLRTTI